MNNLDQQFFYLHKWCIPVKGIVRSSICDFQRETLELVPNEMCDILLDYNGSQIEKVFKAYEELEGSYDVICEYFEFLVQKEFVYLTEKEDVNISKVIMDTSYESPYHINSCIIDFNKDTDHPIKNIINELNVLGCNALQLRFYDEITIANFKAIIELTNNTAIRNVSIIMKYVSPEHHDDLKELLRKDYCRILDINIHSAPMVDAETEKVGNKNFTYSSTVINDCSSCGVISPYYFEKNYYTYTIGQNNNTCLYKKVSVDVTGEIKNCPSLKESLGNINSMTLADAILDPKLKRYWNITKDQISTCKTCEFRLVCTDCRAYTEDDKDIYAKPKKCNYDPEKAAWIS
ncbi:MAG: grasp-with-spasm system SPASM domain peptide maturase [Crocinitomix sp.]|nr:grasp-with-spasm system SPASM domain peptide maturase [Crocinitomix sp.]